MSVEHIPSGRIIEDRVPLTPQPAERPPDDPNPFYTSYAEFCRMRHIDLRQVTPAEREGVATAALEFVTQQMQHLNQVMIMREGRPMPILYDRVAGKLSGFYHDLRVQPAAKRKTIRDRQFAAYLPYVQENQHAYPEITLVNTIGKGLRNHGYREAMRGIGDLFIAYGKVFAERMPAPGDE